MMALASGQGRSSPDQPAPGRRRLVTALPLLLAALPAGRALAQDEYGDAGLRGAGSTFVQPLMEEWFRLYRSDPHLVLQGTRAQEGGLSDLISNDSLDYEAVGSMAGIQRIRAGLVDFAASEMPVSEAYQKSSGLIQFPWVAGGVAIVLNAGELRLDSATLAAIYMGRITNWSDPAIAALNPGARLADAPIVSVHRSDGSGTTFTLARYLSQTEPGWKSTLGADLLLKWPGGVGAKGGSEMLNRVRATPHAIGYVSAAQARRSGLPIAALRNRAGRFVQPDNTSVSAALAVAGAPDSAGQDLLGLDAEGDQSYPLVATVFGLLRGPLGSRRQRRTAEFVRWTLAGGGMLSERLGYTRLPEPVVRLALARLTAGA